VVGVRRGHRDFLPATGPVSGWRLVLAHVLPLPMAFGCGVAMVKALAVVDGTMPLRVLAVFAFGMGALSLFLQLLVRYAADANLRLLCAVRIAPELLGTNLITNLPPATGPEDLDNPAAGPEPRPGPWSGGERS
jgi:hypothetical protein